RSDHPVINANLQHEREPQWSRPKNGRITGTLVTDGEVKFQPQWSRPKNGRITRRPRLGDRRQGRAAMEPTEERSDHVDTARRTHVGHRPQWSRPKNGRITTVDRFFAYPVGSAAMEPTEERSDHSASGPE